MVDLSFLWFIFCVEQWQQGGMFYWMVEMGG